MIRIALVILALLFFGCSSKDPKADKPAIYWYEEMIKQASWGNTEGAEENFESLKAKHSSSLLLKPAMLIMANMYIKNEEYILANYYLDEYAKRYANKANIDYIKFLKLKANYYGLEYPKRDQKLLLDTKKKAEDFIKAFPNSNLKPFANTIATNIILSEDSLNRAIAKLYKKLDKIKASRFYQQKIVIKDQIGFKEPKSNFIRALFE